MWLALAFGVMATLLAAYAWGKLDLNDIDDFAQFMTAMATVVWFIAMAGGVGAWIAGEPGSLKYLSMLFQLGLIFGGIVALWVGIGIAHSMGKR